MESNFKPMQTNEAFNSWWRDEGNTIEPIASMSMLERQNIRPTIQAVFENLNEKIEEITKKFNEIKDIVNE